MKAPCRLTFAAVAILAACSNQDITSPASLSSHFVSAATNAGDGHGNGGQQDPTPGGGVTRIPVPANLTGMVSGSSVTFSWDAVEGAIQYQINIQCSGCEEKSQKVTTTSVTFSNLANGQYNAKIRAIAYNPLNTSEDNSSVWSSGVSFSVNTSSGNNNPPADVTPPAIGAPIIVGTLGSNGWYNSDVSVTWNPTDPESGISSTSGCSATLSVDTYSQTFTCTATNGAGLSASGSVTIKRDATVPVVTYSGNAASYTIDQSINITCFATDATSGVASSTCQNITGDAYLFPLGLNSYAAGATDFAGNTGSASASFTVNVTTGSLCNLVKRWVTNAGVANSLCVKLDAAARDAARGNMTAKAGSLGAFANEVRAQTGKFIPADKAPYLIYFASKL